MTDDARLTDFGGGDDESEEAATATDAESGAPDDPAPDDGSNGADGAPSDAPADAPVRPGPAAEEAGIATTYQWDPAGRPCAACGAVVERRWRDDGGMVCPDCKEW